MLKQIAPINCPQCGNPTLDEEGECSACEFSARDGNHNEDEHNEDACDA